MRVRFALSAALLVAAAQAVALPLLNHDTVVGPLPAGRFPVACSNIEQDTSRVAPGASPSDYWEGRPVNGVDHYITDILVHPETAIVFDTAVPDASRLYADHAGQSVTFAALVCYPTSKSNSDPDYVLPETGDIIPHMQPAGTAPKIVSLAEALAITGTGCQLCPPPGATVPAQLPMIVFSHGLTGSPISQGYVQVLVGLAAEGYVVAAPFHGDPRFSRVRIQDLSDVAYLFTQFDRIVEMQMMRPLSLKVMLDTLLANPAYAQSIDTTRIGAFGASMGGEAVALLAGAKLTTSWSLACDAGTRDPRIRAVVGYVPYAGQPYLPAFCENQDGAAGVNRPYLAISGTSDTTAPIVMALQAARTFGSSRYLVALVGGQHELRPEDVPAVFTWTLTFLDAYMDVGFDAGAMTRFIKMADVNGGGYAQQLLLDVHVPLPGTLGQVPALEFHNTATNHYFIAPGAGEIDAILHGSAGPGWQLTGQSFNVWLNPTPGDSTLPVCRFYSYPFNSHFFTLDPVECEAVKHNRDWTYEGIGFDIRPPDLHDQCPAGYLGVLRAYNDRAAQNDANHRFTTSDSTLLDMVARGWIPEGIAMCARP